MEHRVMKTDPPDATPEESSIEIYSKRRITEFDMAEAELAEVLRRKKR